MLQPRLHQLSQLILPPTRPNATAETFDIEKAFHLNSLPGSQLPLYRLQHLLTRASLRYITRLRNFKTFVDSLLLIRPVLEECG